MLRLPVVPISNESAAIMKQPSQSIESSRSLSTSTTSAPKLSLISHTHRRTIHRGMRTTLTASPISFRFAVTRTPVQTSTHTLFRIQRTLDASADDMCERSRMPSHAGMHLPASICDCTHFPRTWCSSALLAELRAHSLSRATRYGQTGASRFGKVAFAFCLSLSERVPPRLICL